jgi:hypothetical protein
MIKNRIKDNNGKQMKNNDRKWMKSNNEKNKIGNR